MLKCFEDQNLSERLDREPFQFTHKLLGHPTLSLENLTKVIPGLPKEDVFYSKGLMKTADNFEKAFNQRPKDFSIEEVIETIRVSNSYIMVSSPESDRSFSPLYRELIADVEALMHDRGVGTKAIDPKLYLFIASPNSVTPFHIDRYSTFLMQFRGSKEVSVFQPWDERVVSSSDREAYVAYANTQLPWSLETDAFAKKFTFNQGDALHIPFVSGHHVRNGSEDVSISMSIIFNTQETMRWRKALTFNHASRQLLKPLGILPTPIGISPWRDTTKAYLQKPMRHVAKLLNNSK